MRLKRLSVVISATHNWLMPVAFKDVLHNSLRSVLARPQAVRCVVFLANSSLLAAKRRLATHPELSLHPNTPIGVVAHGVNLPNTFSHDLIV